jgi:pyruvate, water dikinase
MTLISFNGKNEMSHLIDIKDIALTDRPQIGGKNYGLAVLHQAGIPIPQGYALTTAVFHEYINSLGQISNEALEKWPERIYSGNIDKIKEILKPIQLAHKRFVVRSSGISEDGSINSFAGLYVSKLNIQSLEGLSNAIKECYASVFSKKIQLYQQHITLPVFEKSMALVIQEMINSDVSGTLFTVDPVTLNSQIIYIEATYGFGEAISSGLVEPDRYFIQKKPLQILAKKRGRKQYQYQPASAGEGLEVVANENTHFTLTDELVLKLAEMAMLVENKQGHPQDMEFAITKDAQIYFTQTRPQIIRQQNLVEMTIKNPQAPILSGVSVAHGIATGQVINSDTYCNQKDAIVIKKKLTIEAIADLYGANAVITDFLSLTSHPAILMREIGIPTLMINDDFSAIYELEGTQITLDTLPEKGFIYHGALEVEEKTLASDDLPKTEAGIIVLANYRSSQLTSLLSNTDLEGLAMGGESALYDEVKIHPNALLDYDKQPEALDFDLKNTIAAQIESYESGEDFLRSKMVERIALMASMLKPHHYIIYRFIDMISSDYIKLIGGETYERIEDNPVLGLRGAARLLSHQDVFNIELEAIKIAKTKYKVKLKLLIPFVRCAFEAKQIVELIKRHQIDEPIGIMIETPASLFFAKELVKTVDFFAVGASDLTQLFTGFDRNSNAFNSCIESKAEGISNAIKLLFENLSMASTSIYLGPGIYSYIAKRNDIHKTNNTITIVTLPDVYLQTMRDAAHFSITTSSQAKNALA